jgi:hypothetical protein
MLKKILLPISLIAFGSVVCAQTAAPLLFNLEDETQLLTVLFDSETINPQGEVLWEPPGFSDKLLVSVSDDGYFHTRLDTILYFSTFGINQAVAVFATYNYQKNEINNCQSCGAQLSFATFDETLAGQWQIERFAKHLTALGSMGDNGEVSLMQFGENQWCLQLGMSWMGQGIYSDHISFWDLDDFTQIFTFTTHEDNSGVLGLAPDHAYSFDRSLHFLNQENAGTTAWWDFDVVSRGTRISEMEEIAVSANYVQRYTYNWETGGYMKVCP